MCLSVAVLCMGILAANSATYNITGNMSYNMIDGVALVNTRVYKVAGTTSASDLSTACTNLSSKSFEEIERDTSTYYILSQKLDSQPLINTSSSTYSSKTTSVDIVYGAVDSGVEYYTYYIVIEIKNVSADTGYVLNAYLSTLSTSTISNIASNANGSSNAVEIESGEYSNIVIGLSYTGTTTTAETFNYTLNMSYEEIRNPVKSLLSTYTDANGDNYWGVELGQVSSSDTTKLKWRLVSLNGTSAYTYSTTTPTVGSGSVFVQETALTNNSVEWGSSYSNTNYFTESTLRTSIKNGGLFNLSDTEKDYLTSGYIKARTLDDISWSCKEYDTSTFTYPYTDSSHTALTSSSKGTDYFWLMSVDEACLYFNDPLQSSTSSEYNYCHTNIQWKPSGSGVSFWLRSPCYLIYGYYYYDIVTCVYSDVSFNVDCADFTYGVRAAFQLA